MPLSGRGSFVGSDRVDSAVAGASAGTGATNDSAGESELDVSGVNLPVPASTTTNTTMNVVRVRLLRRHLLSDPALHAQQSDEVALRLAYSQARGLVLSGSLAVPPAACVQVRPV